MVFFLISYSCSQESDADTMEKLEAIDASARKGNNPKERPWKINSAGTFAPDFSVNCEGLLPLRIEGTGVASHTGRFDVSIIWCTGGIGAEFPNFITGTITAANGDKIFFESVEFRPFEVDYIVTGGTGRFEGAEGEFTLTQTEFVIESPQGAPPSGTYANEGGGFIVY